MDHLPLQVRQRDRVVVDHAERADAGRGQIEQDRRAEAAGADDQHARLFQRRLAGTADLAQHDVAGVSFELFRTQHGSLAHTRQRFAVKTALRPGRIALRSRRLDGNRPCAPSVVFLSAFADRLAAGRWRNPRRPRRSKPARQGPRQRRPRPLSPRPPATYAAMADAGRRAIQSDLVWTGDYQRHGRTASSTIARSPP